MAWPRASFNSTGIKIGMKKYTPVALAYIASYVLIFIARSVFETPAVFLVGVLVTACLCVSVCRRVILAILLRDQAWKYGGKIVAGPSKYLVVLAVSLPTSLLLMTVFILSYWKS